MKSCTLHTDSYSQHTLAYSRVVPIHTGTTIFIVRVANDFYHVVVTTNIRMDRMARMKENMSVGKAKNLDKQGTGQCTELFSVASVSL
jgi:hypothetical protein